MEKLSLWWCSKYKIKGNLFNFEPFSHQVLSFPAPLKLSTTNLQFPPVRQHCRSYYKQELQHCVRCICVYVAGMWISMWVWCITGWLQMYSFITVQLLLFNHCVYLCKGLFTFCCLLSRHVCRQMCLRRDQWATQSLHQFCQTWWH